MGVKQLFAERLKELREENNMTQEQLGKLLNVTKQAISSYEKGENEPSLDTLVKIAEIFNVSLDYLFGRTKQKDNLYIQNEILINTLNDKNKRKFLIDICKILDNYSLK